MKTLLCILLFVSIVCKAQVSPPVISPSSIFINFNESTTLTASGCSGTIIWNTGATGATLTVSPKQSASFTAVCTVGGVASAVSNSVLVQVGLTESPCNANPTVSTPLTNVGQKTQASNTITGTSSIENTASVQFKSQKIVQLNPGFQAKSGSVFKAYIAKCGELSTRDVATGLNYPWEILWGADNFIWMTERAGTISKVDPTNGTVQNILTISDVYASGEGGLLGMVLHPSFTSGSPFVYVAYNYLVSSSIKEKIVRYTYDASSNTLSSPFILLDNVPGNTTHNGCRLIITSDLKLFITTGDAQNLSAPQSKTDLAGKILRLNLDGTIPSDNPVLPPNTSPNAIWSIGHRNPQGMVMANNKLYTSSHGASTEDEINLIQKGANYGWPNVEGPCNTTAEATFCQANNALEPIFSSGGSTWAFCGLDYYNNDRYPRWKNNLLMVSLKNQTLYAFKLSADGNTIASGPITYFVNQFNRLRDIAIAPDGRVFICTSIGNSSDRIVEITPQVD
ncbi:MAG: PQQ-dependent sugar dehydrogenase [Leadbetterella sp.]